MNVIFACGGTGGHINPALAVANAWKERHPEGKILFIGGQDEMEQQLVPAAGFQIVGFDAACFQRGLHWKTVKYNCRAVGRVVRAVRLCRRVIREFGADVVIGTGGYASFPPLMAARLLGIPTCVHESNAQPGLTTRLVADWVDRILICFPESAKRYRRQKVVQAVGMPVRREFIFADREESRRKLGLCGQPVIVSAFGSQGARAMNLAVGGLFRLEQNAGFPFHHIHAVGSYGWDWMPGYVKEQGVDLAKAKAIDMREYIYNMPDVMAAADLVISRAGASSCNEIAAAGIPCILIPSPNVTENHQEKNARAMEAQGGAVVLLEKDCTPERLYGLITELLADGERRKRMRTALQGMAIPNSAEQICDVLEDLVKRK